MLPSSIIAISEVEFHVYNYKRSLQASPGFVPKKHIGLDLSTTLFTTKKLPNFTEYGYKKIQTLELSGDWHEIRILWFFCWALILLFARYSHLKAGIEFACIQSSDWDVPAPHTPRRVKNQSTTSRRMRVTYRHKIKRACQHVGISACMPVNKYVLQKQ